jgi:TetR/AcrR family transcriptional regulator, copper-responsive repressor
MRGRPREFDKGVALDQAMRLFWEKGYDGTSLVDLADATNLNPPSIYAAFRDKQNLFLLSVDHYYETFGAKPTHALMEHKLLIHALPAFFGAVVKNIAGPTTPRGCFIVCALANKALENKSIQAKLSLCIQQSDMFLQRRFDTAIDSCEISKSADPRNLARLTNSLRHGMALRARAGERKTLLLESASEATSLIMTHLSRV